jgi:hypothetical protein
VRSDDGEDGGSGAHDADGGGRAAVVGVAVVVAVVVGVEAACVAVVRRLDRIGVVCSACGFAPRDRERSTRADCGVRAGEAGSTDDVLVDVLVDVLESQATAPSTG